MAGKYKRIYLGIGATLISLFTILTIIGLQITSDGDKICQGTELDPCISYLTIYNPTAKSVYIYNKEEVTLDFSPDIERYELYVEYYGKWVPMDFTMETRLGNVPKDRLYVFVFPRYSTKKFKLVGYKNNPTDNVKWSMGAPGDLLDPVWIGEPFISGNITEAGVYVNTQSHYDYRTYENIKTNNTLYCNKLNYTSGLAYKWYKNNEVLSGETSSTLASNIFMKGDLIFCGIDGTNSTDKYIIDTTIGDFSNGTTNFGNITFESGNVTLSHDENNLADTLLLLHFDNNFSVGAWENLTDDVSIYDNNGVCTSMETCPEFNQTGYIGGAFEFDGVDDYINVSDADFRFNTGDFSVAFWGKRTTTGEVQFMLDKRDGNLDGWAFLMEADNTVTASLDLVEVTSTNIMPNNKWIHIVAVYDRSDVITLYFNGASEATSASISGDNMDTTKSFVIGKPSYFSGANEFTGTIDEVRVWNRSLTAEEIRREYQKNLKLIPPSLNNYEHNSTFTSEIFDLGKNPNMSEISWGQDIPHSSYYFQDNLIFGWDGSIKDSYFGGYTGTLGGGLLAGNNESIFPDNNATTFDGSDDYIHYGNLNFLDTTDFSMSAWIKTNDSGNIMRKRASGGGGAVNGYIFDVQTGKLFLQLDNDDGSFVATSSTGIVNDGIWHHVVTTLDRDSSTGLKYYIDGVQDATVVDPTAVEKTLNNARNFAIGARGDGVSGHFNGTMDELHIWNRALSSGEINHMYNISKNKYPIVLQTKMGNFFDVGDEDVIFGWHGDSVKDYIGGLVGTEIGGLLVNNKEGYLGGGTEFDGLDDYIDLDNTISLDSNNEATFSIWIKTQILDTDTGDHVVFGLGADIFTLFQDITNNGVGFIVKTSGGDQQCSIRSNSVANLDFNEWTHIVGTYDGVTTRLYKNGVLKTTSPDTCDGNIQSTTTFKIGSSAVGAQFFNGTIDEVHIYKKALSSGEVTTLYESYLNWGDWVSSNGTIEGYYLNSTGELINSTYNGTDARYIQYRASFETLDTNVTPKLMDVELQQTYFKIKIFNSQPFSNFSLLYPPNNTWIKSQQIFNITGMSDLDGLTDLRWNLEIDNDADFSSPEQAFYNLSLDNYIEV